MNGPDEYDVLDDVDPGSDGADVRAQISVNAITARTSTIDNDDHAYPTQWLPVEANVPDARGFERISLVLSDYDGSGWWNPADRLDVSKRSGLTSCEIQYSPELGSWTGDDQHLGSLDLNGPGHCSGDEDGNPDSESPKDAQAWFKVQQHAGRCEAPQNVNVTCRSDGFAAADGDLLPYYWERQQKASDAAAGINNTHWDPWGPSDGDYDNDTLENYAEWQLERRPEARDLWGFNVSVGLAWTDVAPSDFARLQEGIRRTGDYLWEATEGRFYFANVTFQTPGDFPVPKAGDIRIYVYNETAKWVADNDPGSLFMKKNNETWWPKATWMGIESSRDEYITMPMRAPQNNLAEARTTHLAGSDSWSRNLLHEMGHFVFGLHEEYEGWTADGKETSAPSCFMSLMDHEGDAQWFSFDFLGDLADSTCRETKQWQLYDAVYRNVTDEAPWQASFAYEIETYPFHNPAAEPSNWRVIFDRYKARVDFDLDGDKSPLSPQQMATQTYITSNAHFDPFSHPSPWGSMTCLQGRCSDA